MWLFHVVVLVMAIATALLDAIELGAALACLPALFAVALHRIAQSRFRPMPISLASIVSIMSLVAVVGAQRLGRANQPN